MVINMDESRLGTIGQIEEFLSASTQVEFSAHGGDIEVQSEPGRGTTFHIANPQSATLQGLVDALHAEGVPLAVVSDAAWRTRRSAGIAQSAAWLGLCRSLSRGAFARQRASDLFQATNADFRMENTLAGLAGSGLACPPPTSALLRLYARAALRRSTSTQG